jgi:hypothetical protein
MSLRSTHYRRRAQQQMRVRPLWVTYRRVQRTSGPYAAANPPRYESNFTLILAPGTRAAAVSIARAQVSSVVMGDADPALVPVVGSGVLVVNGAHAAGATTLSIRAVKLRGSLFPGDTLTLAGVTYTVSTAGGDNGQGVITAGITPGLAAAASDGMPITAVTWAAETRIPTRLVDYGQALIDGKMVIAGDHKITFAAADLAFEPAEQDQLVLPNGKTVTIIRTLASRLDGEPVTWDLQAR